MTLKTQLYLCGNQLHASAIYVAHLQGGYWTVRRTIIQCNKILGKCSRLTLICNCIKLYTIT